MGNFSFCLQSISLIGYNDTNRSHRAYGLNCLRINTAGLLYLGVFCHFKDIKMNEFIYVNDCCLAASLYSSRNNLSIESSTLIIVASFFLRLK